MRIPTIRIRRTLTIRSLMIVVALVAVGIAGWKAKQHWLECRKGERIVRELGMYMEDRAFTARELAEEIKENPKDFEAGNPERDFVLAEWTGDVPVNEMASVSQIIARLRRSANELDSLGVKCKRFERRYHEASLRPWVEVESIDREVAQMTLGYRKSRGAAE